MGQCPVSHRIISSLKERVESWTQPGHPGYGILTPLVQANNAAREPLRLCVLDGFLLYSSAMAAIQPFLDLKLFLLVSYERAKARREARSGYVTLEGFWEDPPGYVDKIVWPNYVEDHSFLFEDGDVEGKLNEDMLGRWQIHCQTARGLDVDMETTLKWAVESIMSELEARAKDEGG